MDPFRRKKWLGIAQRYPAMSAGEQASIQRNMQEWARLAPEERKAAREKFKTLKKAGPEQQQSVRQKWEEYQALPQEERDRLSERAARRIPPKTPIIASSPASVSGGDPQKAGQSRSPISPLKTPQSTLLPKQKSVMPDKE